MSEREIETPLGSSSVPAAESARSSSRVHHAGVLDLRPVDVDAGADRPRR